MAGLSGLIQNSFFLIIKGILLRSKLLSNLLSILNSTVRGLIVDMPTKKQIDAGNRIAAELMTASIQKSFSGQGGCKEVNVEDYEFKEIVKLYLSEKIDSVTGIWLAMQSV